MAISSKIPEFLNLTYLKLGHQGLILVGLLLTLELSFVGSLYMLLGDAELEARKEAHSKEIIGKTQQLVRMLYDVAISLEKYGQTRQAYLEERYRDRLQEINSTIAWLEEALKPYPEDAYLFKGIETKITTGLKILTDSLDRFDRAPEVGEHVIRKARQEVQPYLDGLVPELMDYLRNQRRIVKESPEKQRQSRQVTKRLLAIGITGNVLVALILAAYFTGGITSRLRVVLENTERLKSDRQLNPPVPGRDEIAELDCEFHDMAATLQEAARKEREIIKMRQSFVAMVSHELRTPLSSVRGFLELLETGVMGQISAEARSGTERAQRSVNRLIGLINELLDLEKMEAGKIHVEPRPLQIQEILDSSCEALREFALEHKVHIDMPSIDSTITADKDRMIQVMVNLLSNAIKYSPENETVRVTVEEEPQHIRLAISDQGPGIPPKYHDLIFERFQQMDGSEKHRKKGTGLGLAISKIIVEQHGGTIGVDSKEGEGSTFWVRLPR